jgi:hypothetical protein
MKKDYRGLKFRFETKWRRICGMPGVPERLMVSSSSAAKAAQFLQD